MKTINVPYCHQIQTCTCRSYRVVRSTTLIHTKEQSLDCFPLIFSFNMLMCSCDIVEFVTFVLVVLGFFRGYVTTGKYMSLDNKNKIDESVTRQYKENTL